MESSSRHQTNVSALAVRQDIEKTESVQQTASEYKCHELRHINIILIKKYKQKL